ncbi:MAG: ATP-binding protein [Candidatus Altimarinota bacterium]
MPLYITVLYLFCGTITLVISVLSLMKNPHSPAHRSYFFFTMSVLIWLICMYFGYYLGNVSQWYEGSLTFIRGAYAASFFLGLGLCGFFHYFPRPTIAIPRWVVIMAIVITTALSGIALFTPLIEKALIFQDGVLYGDEFGPWYQVYVWYFLGSLLLAILLGIQKIWSSQGLERKKIIMAAFGCWVFLFFGVATNVVLPLWGIFILQLESPTFSLFFIIPAFYAMQKYRFFNFSFASLKILRASLLFAGFAGITLTAEWLLPLLFAQTNLPPLASWVNSVLGISIGLLSLKHLEKIFPEFISSQFREFRYQLDQLKSSIYYCGNYSELVRKIESAFVLNLHFTSVQLYLIREKKNHIEIPIYYADHFSKSIETEHTKVLITEELELQKKPHQLKKMKELDASICFPLYLETKLIGFLLLGHRPQKDSYSREEIQELIKTKQFIELCFINILLQSDLKEENDLMKQLINEKTNHLKKQNEKIKHLLSQQSDFIAVTAHEFRTPLNIALLQLEDTLDSYDHSSQVLEDMKVLENSLDKLKHLTQNLFDVQQYDLKKAKLHLKDVDIATFVSDIFEELKDITSQKTIELSLDQRLQQPVLLKVDEFKLRQVMYNLLTNAQKFIPEGGTITIRTERTAKSIDISIIDNGPGIPDEAKKKIFHKFQTSQSHMGMGIGLGLYLCKQIVDLHKGQLAVSDTPGGGATFTISLPKPASKTRANTSIKPRKKH